MDSLLKTLIRSKRFQDIAGVFRGLDRVKLGLYETRYSYTNYHRIYRGERNLDDLDDVDDFNFESPSSKDFTDDSDLGVKTTEKNPNTLGTQTEPISIKPKVTLSKKEREPISITQVPSRNFHNDGRGSSKKTIEQPPPSGNKIEVKVEEQPGTKNSSEQVKRVEIDVQSGTFKRDSGIEVRSNNIKDENLNAIRAAEAYKKTSTNESHRDSEFERKVGKENPVPSSSFSRAYNIAELGASLLSSVATNSISNIFSNEKTSRKDILLSDENAKKIGDFLCRMRGAPLKLGQALSMQEDAVIPRPIKQALERAQRSADIMPVTQLTKMLDNELGQGWEDKFTYFDKNPMAAASIGQVHFATTKKGMDVAVKIQYPGVAESIDSDLNNIKRLMKYTKIFPKQLFMDDIIRNARSELKEECDYKKEAHKQLKFRDIIKGMPNYYAPDIDLELSTSRVITIEYIKGFSLEQLETQPQEIRDRVGELIFAITLKQLFNFHFMQTDPNPANFFYNLEKDVLYMIDFGAAREYSPDFVKTYLDIVYGASVKDKDVVWDSSKKLGFLTGEENRQMRDAHTNAVLVVGEPFALKTAYDFGNQNLTDRIYKYMPIMFKNRLKAPPPEVYSLHRILSGAYLMCMKLKARVHVGKIFDSVYKEAIRMK